MNTIEWMQNEQLKQPICECGCNKEITIIPVHRSRGIPRYLKGHCYVERKHGIEHCSWKGGLPNCIDCGKKLTHYESKRCPKCYRKQSRGKNHPSWKGGITPLRVRLYQNIEYKEWRKAVFKRDDYICQVTGIKGGEIEAHHDIAFSILFQEAKIALPNLSDFDACIQYPPMWDINNGITLSKKTHRKLHKEKQWTT